MEVQFFLHRQGNGPYCSADLPITIRRPSPHPEVSFRYGHHQTFGSWRNEECSPNKNKLIGLTANLAASPAGGHNLSAAMRASADASKRCNFLEMMNAFHRFIRPYAITGTVLGVVSVSLLAVQSWGDLSPHLALEVIRTLIPTVLMHFYVVGINQVIDVEIDKVNKPYLPLASGEFSLNFGVSLTILCATLAFVFGAIVSSKILTRALIYGFLFGCGYSLELPLLRWKKWGPAATLSILFYRTFVVQICTFLHIQTYVLKRATGLNKSIIFLSCFTCVLSSVVAVFKDIPDLEGDKAHGVQSFAVHQGPERVFWFCIYALTIAYSLAIIVGTTSKLIWAKLGMVIGHGTVLVVLWHGATQVDPKDRVAVSKFYMFIWKLLYAELFLAQFAR